jgi:anti-sigma factor RsiW
MAYAIDQIRDAESSLIASHLAACSECTTTVFHVRTIRAILRDDDTEAPPPATVARAIAIFPSSNGHAQDTVPFSSRVKEIFRRLRRFSFAPIPAALVLALILFSGVT